MMILQNDPELVDWVFNLDLMHAGDFLRSIGSAAQRADVANYSLMRPLLRELKKKYPQYDPPLPETATEGQARGSSEGSEGE
jgi:hypothetical protein